MIMNGRDVLADPTRLNCILYKEEAELTWTEYMPLMVSLNCMVAERKMLSVGDSSLILVRSSFTWEQRWGRCRTKDFFYWIGTERGTTWNKRSPAGIEWGDSYVACGLNFWLAESPRIQDYYKKYIQYLMPILYRVLVLFSKMLEQRSTNKSAMRPNLAHAHANMACTVKLFQIGGYSILVYL